jgi:AraC-like DNA-binding protein
MQTVILCLILRLMDNWKVIIYLLGFGQGIVLCISLVVRGLRKGRSSLFLGLILLVLAQELLNAWAMQIHYHSRANAFRFWNFQSYLMLPLALWFFVRCTTESDFVFKPRDLLYFLPIVAEIAIRCFWQLSWNSSSRPIPSLLGNPIWFFATELLPIIGMVVVLVVYGYRLLRIFRQKKPELSSYPRYFGLLGLFLVLTLLWIGGVIFGLAIFLGIEILICLCFFVLGYIGYLDPNFFILPMPTMVSSEKIEKQDFARFDDNSQLQRLRMLFETERLYTHSSLTLDDVAGRLHLPVRYLSYLINSHCDTNFNGFVNTFRIQEVLSKLADSKQQHKTILALALESGFNSKSTFNQVFRLQTGTSPSQFLQKQKELGALVTGQES